MAQEKKDREEVRFINGTRVVEPLWDQRLRELQMR